MDETGNDTIIEENTEQLATPDAGSAATTGDVEQKQVHDAPPVIDGERSFRRFTLCNYSLLTSIVILLMVVAGAGRSVAVKAYFQVGFDSPLLVTILYLIGSFLCIIPYYTALLANKYYTETTADKMNIPVTRNETNLGNIAGEEERERDSLDEFSSTKTYHANSERSRFGYDTNESIANSHLSLISLALSGSSSTLLALLDDSVRPSSTSQNFRTASFRSEGAASKSNQSVQIGSVTGLTRENEQRVSEWVQRVPTWMAPVIPGVCNVVKSFLRWATLIYISASVAEILIGGLELVFIVLAARIVRKRAVSRLRWLGVIVVCVGIAIVGGTNVMGSNEEKEQEEDSDKKTGTASELIGIAMVVAQCLVSVVQDILEEIFIQCGDQPYPALLFVGVEGAVGLAMGIVLYYPAAMILGEEVQETWEYATSSASKFGFLLGLTLLFMVAAVFNILACAATSSMTRNMWGNLRTALVWVLGLLIYYSSASDGDIGEPWRMPDSFIILLGFGVILYGLRVYYREKAARRTTPACGGIQNTVVDEV